MEPSTPTPPIPSQRTGNWWTRNWKWFVPTGCLTLLALFAAFIISIVMIVVGAMKSTDVYKQALERARESPAVIEALGAPIKEGFFVSGNTKVDGASGESNLSIPISGPKGKGTIYLKAEKTLGRWNFLNLEVEIEKTGERIDVLKESNSGNSL
jgi:Cytochrome oxidase complex assembly protein 1